jgi:hypothetical protein
MRVRCTNNDLAHIRDSGVLERLRLSIHIDGSDANLDVGQEYAVQAVEKRSDSGLWLYVHSVPESEFPYPHPIEFFEIVDSAIPNDWQAASSRHGKFCLSFREWVSDDGFCERLVNGEAAAIKTYRSHLRTH